VDNKNTNVVRVKRTLADDMAEKRASTLRFAERENLGALKGESVLGETIVYTFERGQVTERLPANARRE